MELWVGTSGYSYPEWEGSFYPPGLPDKEMLAFYARQLPAVEINNTFYRLPRPAALAAWAAQVPRDFRFSLKASQKITHVKRLRGAADEVAFFLRAADSLGEKLGALLFQLPPYLKRDKERLESFLSLLPEGAPVAFEFRHPSWFEDEVFALLDRRGLAVCVADTAEGPGAALRSSPAWGYVRMRRPAYSDADLLEWSKRIAASRWRKAFVFFKHEEAAPRLAARFLQLTGLASAEAGRA